MPANEDELEEALGEGVTMRWLSTVSRFEGDRLVLEKMRLDEEGSPQPTGETESLDADSLVLALGQDTDLTLLDQAPDVQVEDGVIEIRPTMMTGESGVFAGGTRFGPPAPPPSPSDTAGVRRTASTPIFPAARRTNLSDTTLATFDRLNTWYYADAPRMTRPELERVRRQSTFDEVVGSLTEENALFEARRCLSCGNCFECDNCFGVCPDNAVIKLGPSQGYEFDLEYCKGCGICAQECPCGAIDMVPEQI